MYIFPLLNILLKSKKSQEEGVEHDLKEFGATFQKYSSKKKKKRQDKIKFCQF